MNTVLAMDAKSLAQRVALTPAWHGENGSKSAGTTCSAMPEGSERMANKMAEYIVCRNCDSSNCKGCNIYTLAMMLYGGKFDCIVGDDHSINPTIDVVPVVRCKDCKYFGRDMGYGKHDCKKYEMPYCLETDFCSYGERKE